jgi:uncharacterized membrane protein
MQAQPTMVRDQDGFRLRGGDVTRLEAFVDAAFAFAVTLLVVSFDAVPDTYVELMQALRRGPAFLAAFAILAVFWLSHHRFSRRYGLQDGWVTFYSLALVGITLLYVYPLRMIMGLAMSAMTGGWAPSALQISTLEHLRGVYIVYALGFAAMSLLIALLYRHAWRRRAALQLDATEVWLTRMQVWAMGLLCVPSVLSILLALFGPETGVGPGLPGLVYCLLPVVMPMFGAFAKRRAPRIDGRAA